MTDLRQSAIKKGTRTQGTGYYQISDRKGGSEVINISFETQAQFEEWGRVLAESMKSDDEFWSIVEQIEESKDKKDEKSDNQTPNKAAQDQDNSLEQLACSRFMPSSQCEQADFIFKQWRQFDTQRWKLIDSNADIQVLADQQVDLTREHLFQK